MFSLQTSLERNIFFLLYVFLHKYFFNIYCEFFFKYDNIEIITFYYPKLYLKLYFAP